MMLPETKRFLEAIEYLISKRRVTSGRDFALQIKMAPSAITELKKGRNKNVGSQYISMAEKLFDINSERINTGKGPILKSDKPGDNEVYLLKEKIKFLLRENELLRQFSNANSTILHPVKKHKRNQAVRK